MIVRVAVNGFGRMGRAACRIIHERVLGLEVVAVNELGSPATMTDS